MNTVKWIVVAVILAAFAAMALRIAYLKAERAELRAEVSRQEELVRNREAKIKGLETAIARKETEIAAVSSQVGAIRDAMGAMIASTAAVEGIFAGASDAPPKNKEDVSDANTSRKALRYLNDLRSALVASSLRHEAAAGNQGSGRNQDQPLPEAVP